MKSVPPQSLSESLAPEFTRNQRWQDNLAKRFAHKAVDIPEEMKIEANKTGISGWSVAGIVAAAGLGPAAMGLGMLWNQRDKLPVQLPGVDKVLKQDADVKIGKPIVEDE